MGFVVLLIVFGLVGLCIGVAKGVNSSGCDQRQGSGTVSDRGWSDTDFDEDLAGKNKERGHRIKRSLCREICRQI